nr:hypothetical protein [Tanacetum cinerariifolium]
MNEPIVSKPTVTKPVIETSEAKDSADKPKVVRKNFGSPLIKHWISDNKDEAESKYKIEKEIVKPSFAKIKFVKSKKQVKSPRKTTIKQDLSQLWLGSSRELIFLPHVQGNPHQDLQDKRAIDSGCSRHMTINMSYLTDYVEIDGGYASFKDLWDTRWMSKVLFSKERLKKSQDKYVDEILKKYGFLEVYNASTPMETQKPLLKDEDGEEVDVHLYSSMIGLLMYLTSSRLDIMFASARYQVNPKVSHLYAVKKIFKYLKGQPKFGLWYPKDSTFDLIEYIDSDYARASFDRKSTIGVDGKKMITTKSTIKRDLQLEDAEGVDYLPNAAIFKQLTLMGFVQVFLNNQLEGMPNHNRIYVTPSHIKKIFGNMRRVGKDFSRKETPLFSTMMVQAQEEMGEFLTNLTDPHHTPTIIQPSTSQPQKTKQHRKPRRKVTKVRQPSDPTEHAADKSVNEEMDDSLERVATTATSLDAKQDKGNIFKTQSKAIPNKLGSQETSSGGGPRCQETMGDTIAQTRSERVSKFSNDPLLVGVNTPQSGEDSLKHNELMELCTKLQQRVLDLETTKTNQAMEIDSLKGRVKKLERRKRSRTHGLKRLYKVGLSARVESFKDEGLGEEDVSKHGRIADIDANENIYLVNVHNDEDMFGVNDLDGDKVIIESVDVAEQAKEVVDDITLAKALMEIKSANPKANKVVIQEPEQGTTTTIPIITTAASSRPKAKGLVIHEQEQAPTPIILSQQPSQVKDKGKGKMVESKLVKKLSKKDQLMLDEELAFRLQAEEEEKEEERLAREKTQQIEEVNIAWDDVQAKINVDCELAQRLQAKEQEELTNAEKCMEIIPDDGDDVTIDATPLYSKSPTIVYYKIHKEGKKSNF